MYQYLKSMYHAFRSILLAPFILPSFIQFWRADTERRFSLRLRDIFPQIFDRTYRTNFDRHYVYHTSWAIRKVRDFAPERHVDIASSLYFPGLLSAFIPVDFYDYRPADLKLTNLTTNTADLTDLPFPDNSIRSLSCLHTIEHIGLGRYGDPIDPTGDQQAARELTRVLKPGGRLLIATPVGATSRIEFNAHRIYTYDAVCALFPKLELIEFSCIPELGPHGITVRAHSGDLQKEMYACGCFVFTK